MVNSFNVKHLPEYNFLCHIQMDSVQSLPPLFHQVSEGQLLDTTLTTHNTHQIHRKKCTITRHIHAFSALTLLVGHQEEHLACKIEL